MNFLQEELIPFKYHEKSSETLIQANGEKLINKIPNAHICHDGIYFETVFALIKDLPSKIILGTPFMALLYPFLVTDKGIKTNVLGKYIFFRFIIPLVLKEKHSSKKVTIGTDVNKGRICRGHLTENSLDGHLTDDDKKKVQQDKETEICPYSPIAFLRKYQHKIQSIRAKELSRKGIKDGNVDVVFCSYYAWIDSMIEVPNKIIVNDIFTVSLNIHMTDILIKEALTDTPLFIIKENVNCGNYLNNGIFTLLIDRINYNSLTDFPIN